MPNVVLQAEEKIADQAHHPPHPSLPSPDRQSLTLAKKSEQLPKYACESSYISG